MTAVAELASRLAIPEGLRRLGQALWMRIDNPVERSELLWANALLGERGDDVLWRALLEIGAIIEPQPRLNAIALAQFLEKLSEGPGTTDAPRLVWTLPEKLGLPELSESYARAAEKLIDSASRSVIIVSPYMEPRGIGKLLESLLNALMREVGVTVVTHGAEDLASSSSAAVEDLRKESTTLPGALSVYSAAQMDTILLHPKIVLSDDSRVLIGSANITRRGLGANLEAGVELGRTEAKQVRHVVNALLKSELVNHVFSTRDALK